VVLLQIKPSGSGDENKGKREYIEQQYEVMIYNCENIHTFSLEKLISSRCFLNKYSKDLFDNGVDIHRRKEDFKKKL